MKLNLKNISAVQAEIKTRYGTLCGRIDGQNTTLAYFGAFVAAAIGNSSWGQSGFGTERINGHTEYASYRYGEVNTPTDNYQFFDYNHAQKKEHYILIQVSLILPPDIGSFQIMVRHFGLNKMIIGKVNYVIELIIQVRLRIKKMICQGRVIINALSEVVNTI